MAKRIGIDVGGTFTDVVLYDEDANRLSRTKLLTAVDRPGEVIREALERLDSSAEELSLLFHATTLVTNLIIERRGATVGLLTTRGFRDVLEIGLSYRPEPFDLLRPKLPPLVPRPLRRELDARVGPDGEELVPLDPRQVVDEVSSLVDAGVEAIAIAFLHSYANPAHERAARDAILVDFPELAVSISSEVDPQIREYERTSSTVLNAYAMPEVARYVRKLAASMSATPGRTFYMHSGGGVAPPARVQSRPVELVLSGPSAGVLAAAYLGERLGLPDLMTFDIGGTSCDVCLIEGGTARERDSFDVEWGMPIRVRCIDVTSVGAGGGSIAWIDAGRALRVGPRSAGGSPGPACYGFGGTAPTVTDANLVLGLLDAGRFLGGRIELDREAALAAMATLSDELDVGPEELASGIHRIATANMAGAVREITVQRGIDPRGFTLVAFGGAGGQHAIDVAEEMELRSVLFPPLASTLSAFGLLTASLRTTEQRACLGLLADGLADADEIFAELRVTAAAGLGEANGSELTERRFCHLRYLGQTHELTIPLDDGWDGMREAFEDTHERMYGTRLGDPVELVAVGATLSRSLPRADLPAIEPEPGDPLLGTTALVGVGEVPALARPRLAAGTVVEGPCILYEVDSTIYVADGWRGRIGELGELLCERVAR